MENLPEISVIVPVYKVEKVLPRCIDSILNQTYRNFELILVDDGSPDGSGRICDEYSSTDHRIRVIHKKNGGVSSARNCGLKEAIGNYLVFIDSDDWVDPDFFSSLSTYFGQYEMLFFGGRLVTNEGAMMDALQPINMDTKQQTLANIVYSLFKIGLLGYAWSMAIRRSVVVENRILFREGVSIHEDSFFCYDCLFVIKNAVALDLLSYRYVIYGEGIQTLSNQTSDNYSTIALERICYIEKLLYYVQMPVEQRDYIVNHMKYWVWRRCLDWAYSQPAQIVAANHIMAVLSPVRDFSVTSVKGRLLQLCVKANSPYMLLLSKRIARLFGSN